MKLCFTLCSNNYLGQALVLAASVRDTNPDYTFHIGIVDLPNENIDYTAYPHIKFTFVSELELSNFDLLVEKYNIIELNTCVKASYFKYLFVLYPNCSHIHYFDPDIQLFQPLDSLNAYFTSNSILLTPHILEPLPDDNLEPRENMFLNYGIYNLGFLGLKRDSEGLRLLDWWEQHTLGLGYMDVKNGYFVDQLWMNHVPLFFKGVHILREKGYNCAPWNLQERGVIKKTEHGIFLNDNSLLTFYHFSSYNPNKPEQLSSAYTRNTFETCPHFRTLYDRYAAALISSGYNQYKALQCSLYPIKEEIEHAHSSGVISKLKHVLYWLVPPIFVHLFKRFKN